MLTGKTKKRRKRKTKKMKSRISNGQHFTGVKEINKIHGQENVKGQGIKNPEQPSGGAG